MSAIKDILKTIWPFILALFFFALLREAYNPWEPFGEFERGLKDLAFLLVTVYGSLQFKKYYLSPQVSKTTKAAIIAGLLLLAVYLIRQGDGEVITGIFFAILVIGATAFFIAMYGTPIFLAKKYSEVKAAESYKNQKQAIKDAYGAKGWAKQEDVVKLLGDPSNGIHLGRRFFWNGKGHALTVGGAGSGKGTNLIIPTLITSHFTNTGNSIVVLDPKGENAAISAPYLKSQGYDVHIINPFGIEEIKHLGNSRWNPLSDIEKGEEKRICDLIAFSIHNRVSQGEGNFWDNKTRQYISLYLRYELHKSESDETAPIYSSYGDLHKKRKYNYPKIENAYKALMWGGTKRIQHLRSMAEDEDFSGAQEADNILNSLMGETAKTEENIYMSIYEAMNIFGDKGLLNSLSASDFNMKEIAHSKKAIFLCIQHSDLRYYSAWVRMFTDILLKTLTKHYNPQRKVVVLLDEFAQLGYVNEFKNSPAVLRGYNVTLWPIVQELGQLQSIYGKDWETFISNAAVKHWLGGGMDNTTAKYLEERMPLDIKFVGNNADGSPKEVQTKLMTAEQIMKMNGMIVEVAGLDKPIYLDKLAYYDDEFLRKNAAPNPFY